MPNYPEHWLLSWGGNMCDGAEVWTMGIRFAKTGDPGGILTVEDEILDACVGKIRTHMSTGATKWRANVECTWVKFNRINSAGHYADSDKTNVRYLTGADIIHGGSGSPSILPPQIALVITFRTDAARGRASRGRVFVPCPAVEVGSNGQMVGGVGTGAQPIANAWKTFIQELGNLPGIDTTDLAPAVVSGVSPVWHHITKVEVGTVLDTQRRRRSALTEARASATV